MSFAVGNPEIKQIGSGGKSSLFQGKRALITGASSGIGMGTAEALLQRGAEVWICSQNPNRLAVTSKRLNDLYPEKVHSKAVDVCDEGAMATFAGEMAEDGNIDYLFANAGLGFHTPFDETPIELYHKVINVNVLGVIYADYAVISHMLLQGSGYILNTSSLEGFIPNGYHTAYVASKFAVLGLTESLRYEYEDRNIHFATVCPGPVMSNIWRRKYNGALLEKAPGIPPDAISELEAGKEILAGIEEERSIILVTDTARECWRMVRDDPRFAEEWCRGYTKVNGESGRAAIQKMKEEIQTDLSKK